MKDISFFNVTGISVGVIYKNEFVAHIGQNFPNDPFIFEWNLPNMRKVKFPRDKYPGAEAMKRLETDIMSHFKTERERVDKETDAKMKEGWTQWVNMDEEDCRMETLKEQLDKFGLTITFAKTEGTDFEWFKVERKYSLTAAK